MSVIGIFLCGILVGWLVRVAYEPAAQSTVPAQRFSETVPQRESAEITLPSPVPPLPLTALPPASRSVDNAQDPVTELQSLLQSGEDGAAIALFAQTREAAQRDLWRHLILKEARRRAAHDELTAAISLLTALVVQLPLAVEERVALATLYQRQHLPYRQLPLLFEALGVAATGDELTLLDQQIAQGVRAAVSHFGDDVDARIQLYRYLIAQRAAYTPYYIELARLLIDASYLDAAVEQLAIVRHDPTVGEKAAQMLAEVELLRRQALESPVALQRSGNHFIVNALVANHDLRLLIDTGASMTVLSSQAASQLGLGRQERLQTVVVNTVSGPAEAQLYRLDAMAVGAFSVAPIEVAVVELLEMSSAQGLLGMNFLQQFEFRIDQQSQQLFLKYRE